MVGIPYLAHQSTNSEARASGVRASLIWEENRGDFAGVIAGGAVAGTHGNLEGLCVSGIFSINDNLKGVAVAGALSAQDHCNGVAASGICNYVGKKLTGASLTLGCNYARDNGKFALQVGAINVISKYEEGVVVQVGLYNRAGDRSIPLLNVRGLSKVFRKNNNEGKK